MLLSMAFSPRTHFLDTEAAFWDGDERCSLSVYPDTVAIQQGRVSIVDMRQKPWLVVTSRPASFYEASRDAISGLRLRDETGPLIVETGTGLGGYIPHVLQNHPRVTAIAIDPIDYAWLKDRLAAAAELPAVQALGERVLADIQELMARCDAYRSPRVRHIRSSLMTALEERGDELYGSADAAVEMYGPVFYLEDAHVPMRALCRMLKPNGRLYSWYKTARDILSDVRRETPVS